MKIEEMKSTEITENPLNEDVMAKLPYVMMVVPSNQIETASYQSYLKESKIKRIVAGYNEKIFNEPKLSFRDGKYYVFDGQHSIESRKRMNGGKDLPLVCKVFYDMTEEEEALLFAQQTGYSSKPTPGKRMAARIQGGDPKAIAFEKATKDAGMEVSFEGFKGPFKIQCINTAYRMFVKCGPEIYTDALKVIRNAWGGSPESLLSDVVVPMCRFLFIYHDRVNCAKLARKLENADPSHIAKLAREEGEDGGLKNAIRFIYKTYNYSNKTDRLEVKF